MATSFSKCLPTTNPFSSEQKKWEKQNQQMTPNYYAEKLLEKKGFIVKFKDVECQQRLFITFHTNLNDGGKKVEIFIKSSAIDINGCSP